MAAHKITIDIFSAKSIAQAQAALKEYKDDLVSKCKTFVEELAKVYFVKMHHGRQMRDAEIGGRAILFNDLFRQRDDLTAVHIVLSS